MIRRIFIFCAVLMLAAGSRAFCGDGPFRGPWEAPSKAATAGGISYSSPADMLIAAYQKYVSEAGGHRCRMYPSCSAYARECIAKHGFLPGWIMAADRLMRCGRSEERLSPKIWVDGALKTNDPVRANDFWWTKDKTERPYP